MLNRGSQRATPYHKVLDGRKRPVRGLWKRNDRCHARLAVPDRDVTILRNVPNRAIANGWMRNLSTQNLRPLKWIPRKKGLFQMGDIDRLCEAALSPRYFGGRLAQSSEEDRPSRTFRESLLLARAAAHLPKFGFHDCRHFFVSYCVMAGIDFMTIARWVGHKDGGLLVGKVSGHLADEHRRRLAQKLDVATL